MDSSFASLGLKNSRVWRSNSFSNMGIVGIDQKVLWVYADFDLVSGSVFRIALPEAVNLLYTFFQLLPSDSSGSVAQKLENQQAPFGSCEICAQPLWPKPTHNKYSRPRISCVNHPQQGRNMNLRDATQYAQFTRCTCETCGAALQGRQNGATGQIFLACTRCDWKTSLNQII